MSNFELLKKLNHSKLIFFLIEITFSSLENVFINQFVLRTSCLCFSFTGIKFRGMLHHVCDAANDENRCKKKLIGTCKRRSTM